MCWWRVASSGSDCGYRGGRSVGAGISVAFRRDTVVGKGQFGLSVRVLDVSNPVGGCHKEHGAQIASEGSDVVAGADGSSRCRRRTASEVGVTVGLAKERIEFE